MVPHQLALVSEVRSVKHDEVMKVAAALQKQASRDLAPIWNVSATVSAFARLEDVPLGYWPIIVMKDVEDAAGYHEDEDGQPFAVVEAGESWSLTASHECLEMLVDPFGRKLIAGPSPKAGQDRVQFLVEVCDPSEDEQYAYRVNDVLVSDFYTPNYFDPVAATGTRYSFTGAIKKPRQVLKGGYLSWRVPKTQEWWQLSYFGKRAEYENLGKIPGNGSLRAALDRHQPRLRRLSVLKASNPVMAATAKVAAQTETETSAWANSLRRQIAAMKK